MYSFFSGSEMPPPPRLLLISTTLENTYTEEHTKPACRAAVWLQSGGYLVMTPICVKFDNVSHSLSAPQTQIETGGGVSDQILVNRDEGGMRGEMGGQGEMDRDRGRWKRERETELKKYGGTHARTHEHAHTPWNPLSGYGRLHSLIVVAGEMCNGRCYQREMSNGSFKYV